MNQKFQFSLLSLFVVGLAAGCTPSPEKVCNKMEELEGKSEKKKSKAKDPAKRKEDCMTMMNLFKAEAPDAYKCIGKASKEYTTAESMGLAFLACIEKDPKGQEVFKKAMEKEREAKRKEEQKKTDFSAKGTKNTEAKLGSVTFTVDMIEGLVKGKDNDYSVSFEAEKKDEESTFGLPRVQIHKGFGKPKSLDEFAKTHGEKQKISKKEKVKDDMVVHFQDEKAENVRVKYFHAKSGLECEASQYSFSGLANVEGTLKLFEKVCSSMVVKSDEQDYSGKKLVKATATVNKQHLTIEVPEGLKLGKNSSEYHAYFESSDDKKTYQLPRVSLGASTFATSEDSEVKMAETLKHEIKKHEKTPTGFYISWVAKEGHSAGVKLHSKHGAHTVTCEASQSPSNGFFNLDGSLALFLKICQSAHLDDK